MKNSRYRKLLRLSVVFIAVFAITGGATPIPSDRIDAYLAWIEHIADPEDQFAALMKKIEDDNFGPEDAFAVLTQMSKMSSIDMKLATMLKAEAQRLKLELERLEIDAERVRIEEERSQSFADFAFNLLASILEAARELAPVPKLGAGGPQDEESPRILVERLEIADIGSSSQPQYEATLELENVGAAGYVGPYILSAGLAYSRSWIPEWFTIFDTQVGQIDLNPGTRVTLTFPVREVPPILYELFRLHLTVSWTGYADSDPADYIGFVLNLATDGFPQLIGYEEIQ
ncbi:hypothetical protein ACFLSW_03670 [Candidatus Bipolaricaulota bacterium]